LTDYSILRSVSDTINLIDGEDILNLDGLMVLVMKKYEVFDKLGPIVGVAEEYNRPETYSKMLQYIGLKARHEASYEKFQEFLTELKQWEIYYKTIGNVRDKYDPKQYRLPKDFTADVPGIGLYQKYKDSFHLIHSTTAPVSESQQQVVPAPPTIESIDPMPLVAVGTETAMPQPVVTSSISELVALVAPDHQQAAVVVSTQQK
jgi:hypothetical protein